jgi:chitinase
VSARRIELQYATNNGTATGGEDFSPSNGTLVFAPGATSQNINITIFGDNLKEGNETFSITLSNPMNATLGDPSGIGTIIDQDIPSFSIQEASVVEGDAGTTAMNFAVLLSKPSTSETRVNFITSPGTAVSGSDYQHTSGTLVFAPGETAKLVTISIIGDNAVEDDETFQVSLNTPTSGAVIGSGTATGSIFDNDDPQPSFTYCYLPILVR